MEIIVFHRHKMDTIEFPSWLLVVCSLQATSKPVCARISILWIWMKFNFTYSGIVLAAEATLSLDSFFFIALEAIFEFQRFSKTKLDRWSLTKQSKVCCHVNQVARASTLRVGSPRENQFQARENGTTRDIREFKKSLSIGYTANGKHQIQVKNFSK